MLPIDRQKHLETFVLTACADNSHAASPSGEDDSNTAVTIVDGKLSPSQTTSFSTETLIDALICLYDECQNSSLRRDKTISNFLDYSKDIIEKIKTLRLCRNDFEILKVIGRGAFGEVAFVRMKNTERIFAMKILNKWEILKRAETACYREERDVLVKGNPLWITKLHYAFQDNDNLYLVMDYYCGGDLLTLLSKFDRLPEDMTKFYIAETVLAIDSLHKLGYVHRDIKPDNILIDLNGHIRLADFGSCLKMLPDGTVQSNVAVGTPDYISPEILRAMEENQGRYGPECDWWSLGIVMFEMLYGETPFYAESLVDTYGKIMNHENKFCIPSDEEEAGVAPITEDAKSLLRMLICNGTQRLGKNGLEDFKGHAFFKDIDWETLRSSKPPYQPEVTSAYDTSNFDTEDEIKHKETLPPNKNSAFKGYHLPFIGYTYTENSLLNDCTSLIDLINKSDVTSLAASIRQSVEIINGKELTTSTDTEIQLTEVTKEQLPNEYVAELEQLKHEKLELMAKIQEFQSNGKINTADNKDENTDDTEYKKKYEQTEAILESVREELSNSKSKFEEMSSVYEATKQSELDEKSKSKQLERSVRALKIEKDQLYTQIFDLQERTNLQAKDLSEAQNQRKLAVQEFTDVNEKVNELRSKNNKISNELLNKEDEVDDLKRAVNELKAESDKREKVTEDLRQQLVGLNETISQLESEKSEALQRILLNESTKVDQPPTPQPVVDDSLAELNTQLTKELKQLQTQLETSTQQISDLETQNSVLQADIQQIKEKNAANQLQQQSKFQEQLTDVNQAKEKETSFLQVEMKKLEEENQKLTQQVETLNTSFSKLQTEKKLLEDEVALFNESKQAMSKYDWQMNEILQMVNEEKQVRGHLRSLASKLIEEVDTLRSQTAASSQTNATSPLAYPSTQLPVGQLANGNSAAWKNRCSERRDRINAQNMQIALEKEFQAKEQLQEENNNLKQESESRQNKINDLQSQIEALNKEVIVHQNEVKTLRDDLSIQQQRMQESGQHHQLNQSSSSHHNNNNFNGSTTHSLSSLSNSASNNPLIKMNGTSSNAPPANPLGRHPSSVSTNSSTIYSLPPSERSTNATPDETTDSTRIPAHANDKTTDYSVNNKSASNSSQAVHQTPINGHKFEVVTFSTIERCEYCCGILYGICRQAVRCQHKQCRFLCHPKCRQHLPANCPININQRVQLKGVDFNRGIGTLMVGLLKIPKLGGVKKGWIEHHVYLSNARLFVCPIVDNKPSIIPSQVIDIKDPNFYVSKVSESDVIHASKKDIPCILKMVVSKLKNQQQSQPLLFCAKDEKDRNSWINVLRDLNERLIQANKVANSGVPILPIEAKEICDASTIRNATAACVFDHERLLIASEEGIDVIDIKTDCTIQRLHDKKTFAIDVFSEEKLIVSISGKHHQIIMFPTIVVEGIQAEAIKIEETKGCTLFCLGKLVMPVTDQSPSINRPQQHNQDPDSSNNSIGSNSTTSYTTHRQTRLLCVAIKKVVSIYEINSSMKPKYKKLREIELTMVPQSIQIINNQLCIGFQSEFALYSLAKETAPIALLQPDRDKSLQFLIKDPINALMAVRITSDEYLLVFENLGVYVNINGCRSRVEEIMWPSRPVYVAYMDPYLLCFCDRGIDVFNVRNAEWTQILQFPRTKPLDKTGALCLNHESQDSIRLIHLRPAEAEEMISLLTKNRSLIKSKLRKGSLSRTDETYQSLVNSSKNYEYHGALHVHHAGHTGHAGSTSLSYSNSTVSQNNTSQNQSSGGSSRKSLISNPINFQHLQHMGPNDGKSFMTTDIPQANNGSALGLPPISGVRGLNTSLNNSGLDAPPPQPSQKPKTNTTSSSNRQIAKKEISGPTNFRHVVRGLDEYGLNNSSISTKDNNKAQSLSSSRITAPPNNGPPNVPPPPLPNQSQQQQNHISIKSSSLSSSSSSSSSILNSPHSPTSSNNENLSQAISNTLKANSVLYNESFLNRNQQTSNTIASTTASKQVVASTNGSNEVKNPSAGAYENVGYFKIEEESLDTMTQAQTSGQTAVGASNISYSRQNVVNTSSESGSLNSSKRQSNGEIENA